ncbi:MAG: DNA-directed RNA polymerase subunit omega [bacterium]
MKNKDICVGESPVASKFKLVLGAAKRSKQLNFMAKERGLPSNQVALVRTQKIKPPTIALLEILEGKVIVQDKPEKEEDSTAPDAVTSQESSQEAQVSS